MVHIVTTEKAALMQRGGYRISQVQTHGGLRWSWSCAGRRGDHTWATSEEAWHDAERSFDREVERARELTQLLSATPIPHHVHVTLKVDAVDEREAVREAQRFIDAAIDELGPRCADYVASIGEITVELPHPKKES